MMNQHYKSLLIFSALIIAAFLAYGALTMRDQRSTAEKVGDAVHDLSQGAEKAGRELEDRTPGEKIGDAVKDAGDSLKESTNP